MVASGPTSDANPLEHPRSSRRISVVTGVLLLVATGTVLVADALEPTFAAMAGAPEQLATASLLRIIAAGASVGIAISLYPAIRPVDRTLAIGSVAFRTIEAVLYVVAAVAALSLLPLSEQLSSGAGAPPAAIPAIVDSTTALRHSAGLVAVMAFTIGGAMYYAAFYRARLVPRWLSGGGLLAVVLLYAACMLSLFRDNPIADYKVLAAPIFVQEIVLALWLLVRGLAPGDRSAGPRA